MSNLRIIDANLDRIGEGLRFLEDVARFLLDDRGLTEKLKTMRHELLHGDWPFHQRLLQAREAESDVGAGIEEEKHRELPVAVMANARRVQESLRVMEELAKIPDTTLKLDPERFKQARFTLYSIERELLSKLQRRDKIKNISGLFVVIDLEAPEGHNPVEAAGQAIRGGAGTIQLRGKVSSKKKVLPSARQLKELCAEHNVLFIIGGDLDLALATDADGLQLGQDDLPVDVARRLLPIGTILGCSVATVSEAIAAESDGADYMAVGAIYPSSSKPGGKATGLERLREIRGLVTRPLVAFGGITQENATEVIAAGAGSIAVTSAVLPAGDIEEAVRQIVRRL